MPRRVEVPIELDSLERRLVLGEISILAVILNRRPNVAAVEYMEIAGGKTCHGEIQQTPSVIAKLVNLQYGMVAIQDEAFSIVH